MACNVIQIVFLEIVHLLVNSLGSICLQFMLASSMTTPGWILHRVATTTVASPLPRNFFVFQIMVLFFTDIELDAGLLTRRFIYICQGFRVRRTDTRFELIVLSKQRGRLLVVIVTLWLFLILPRCLRLLARILLDMFSNRPPFWQIRVPYFETHSTSISFFLAFNA